MADESIIKKALDLARQGQEFVFPHASKNPFAPMAYVKDFNEFFLPSAQMAIDELQGEEEYPAWAYALASAPFIGKPAKAVAKIAGKGGKAAAKTGRMVDEGGIQSLFDKLNAAEKAWSDKPSLVNQSNRDKALEKLLNSPEYNGHDFVDGQFVPRKASPEWTLTDEIIDSQKRSKLAGEGYETYKITAINPENGETVIREINGTSDAEGVLRGFRENGWKADIEGVKTAKELQQSSPEWTLVKE